MNTIFDTEFETKKSRALGSFVPYGGETSVSWTDWATDTAKGYRLNAIVFTCVHEISTSAAMVPFQIRDKLTKEVQVNALSKVLDTPNPFQDRTTWMESIYAFYLLQGNVGVEAAPYNGSEVRELYAIPFDNVEVHLNKSGMVNNYVVKSHHLGKDVKFRVSSITGKTKLLHLKTFNPEDMWIGQSPLTAAGKDADIFDKAGSWNASLLDNAARPSGVFSYDDVDGGILTDEAYDKLNENIKNNYAGQENAGTPILLEGGLKWQTMSLSPAEMDFLESRAASARIVASAFGYPAMLLGLSGDNTYNNQKEARLALWTDTIMPLCDKVAIQFTTWFGRLGALDTDKYEVVPNYESIGALQPIRDAIWEKACIKGKDILTVNERREMISKSTIPGLDGIVANAAQVPLTFALDDPATRGSVEIVRDNTTKKPNKNKDAQE
jgi:HK97 family phage portal protein